MNGVIFLKSFRYSPDANATLLRLAPAVLVAAIGLGTLYLILRWRESKSERKDPQLGLKLVLNYFEMIAILAVFYGLALLVAALFTRLGKSPEAGNTGFLWRPGFGYLLGGVVLAPAFEAIHRLMTNAREFDAPRRAVWGLLLLVLGLVGVVFFVDSWAQLFLQVKGARCNIPFGVWIWFLGGFALFFLLYKQTYFPSPRRAPAAGYGQYPGTGYGQSPQATSAAPATVPQQPAPQLQPAAQVQAQAQAQYQHPVAQQPAGYVPQTTPAPQPQAGYPQPPQTGYAPQTTPAPQPQAGYPQPAQAGYAPQTTPAPQPQAGYQQPAAPQQPQPQPQPGHVPQTTPAPQPQAQRPGHGAPSHGTPPPAGGLPPTSGSGGSGLPRSSGDRSPGGRLPPPSGGGFPRGGKGGSGFSR